MAPVSYRQHDRRRALLNVTRFAPSPLRTTEQVLPQFVPSHEVSNDADHAGPLEATLDTAARGHRRTRIEPDARRKL
jgi:hypothetical protein